MVLGLESDSELRDDSGLTISQLDAAMEEAEELELDDASTAKAAEGYPLTTNITPELLMHCEALLDLFNSDTPRAVYIRPASARSYRYYIGTPLVKVWEAPRNFPMEILLQEAPT